MEAGFRNNANLTFLSEQVRTWKSTSGAGTWWEALKGQTLRKCQSKEEIMMISPAKFKLRPWDRSLRGSSCTSPGGTREYCITFNVTNTYIEKQQSWILLVKKMVRFMNKWETCILYVSKTWMRSTVIWCDGLYGHVMVFSQSSRGIFSFLSLESCTIYFHRVFFTKDHLCSTGTENVD